MKKYHIGILEPTDFSPIALKRLTELGDVTLFTEDKSQTIPLFLNKKDIVFTRLKHYLTDELTASMNRPRYICSPTTGLNHISKDLKIDARTHLITLKGETGFLNTIRATPEHTLGLIIAIVRNYQKAFMRSDSKWGRDAYKGYELQNNSVGIIGLGRVGTLLAHYLQALDCAVSFYDLNETVRANQAQRHPSIESLIQQNNIIVLTASFEESNKNLLNAELLQMMKGKYLINTARGELIDEIVLIDLLKKNFFAGVALDVIADEQHTTHRDKLVELTTQTNLILTPHIGGATWESMFATEEFIVEKLHKHIKDAT